MSYLFRTAPFRHQEEEFERTKDLKVHARFWEQGTGKTKITIDEFAYNYYKGEVNALLIDAPNGVHRNWITDEITKHLPEDILDKAVLHFYTSSKASAKYYQKILNDLLKYEGPVILAFSYDGFMTNKTKAWIGGKRFARKFLLKKKCFYVLDESHHIKAPGSKRTKSIVASGDYAEYKRILTGTPVAEGPFGAYSPIKFLQRDFWYNHGLGTSSAFKQFFGEWMTKQEYENKTGIKMHYNPGKEGVFVRYKNLDKLQEILKTISSRVLKENVLDIPEKLFSKIYFDMNKEQLKAYQELKKEYMTIVNEGEEDEMLVEGNLAITRLLRLQQITCGYASTSADEPNISLGEKNPRLEAVKDYCDGLAHQAIIWARFSPDIDQLMKAFGDKAVRYDGKISDDECEQSKIAFQEGRAQYFIGNPEKGSEGLTLNMAKTVIYYSNSFKLIKRLQTEDRCHRIGQDSHVNYIDVIAPDTVDTKIVESLRSKYDISSQITGDELKEWI